MRSSASSRILAEDLVVPAEPLAILLRPGGPARPDAVARRAARALLDLPEMTSQPWPAWLLPHQLPAAERLTAIVSRYGGALLADAVGLGKSYVALAVAQRVGGPLTLVVPAVLVPQWRSLLARLEMRTLLVTHEALSRDTEFRPTVRPSDCPTFVIVDEAHHFRNVETKRYRALAGLLIGARVLLVTATPVHNRVADLFHLFRLFLRDHALAGLGLPSLARAARGETSAEALGPVAARLMVARSRTRVRAYSPGAPALSFPGRTASLTVRAATGPASVVEQLVAGIQKLGAAAGAAPLFRIVLLRRLASSLPALRASLDRYAAFLDLARQAATDGRALTHRDFERVFPRTEDGDVQLALLPLLIDPAPPAPLAPLAPLAIRGPSAPGPGDLALVRRLRALTTSENDAKADALLGLLQAGAGKTVIFTGAIATARHLARRVGRAWRVATIVGRSGVLGVDRTRRADSLAAFAPGAQGAPRPAPACEADVLIATDLLSEGLNLQDAARVIHYDLPWSPACLAQRVGRIDRLGSPHSCVHTVAFLPPGPVARALDIEERLAAKVRAQAAAGAAQRETLEGASGGAALLDWCDRLQSLASRSPDAAPQGSQAVVRASERAIVLVIRLAAMVDAFVVGADGVRADPVEATRLLERAGGARGAAGAGGEPLTADPAVLEDAIRRAAPLVRARLAAVADARWRAADRDRLSRRLVPWVLTAARRAARAGNAGELAALDALISRLSLGMTAGEELSLAELVERPEPLSIDALQRWHERLPAVGEPDDPPEAELVAAVVLERT